MDGERQPKSSFSYSNLFNLEVFDMGFVSSLFNWVVLVFFFNSVGFFFLEKAKAFMLFYSSFLGNSNWVCLISFFFGGVSLNF